MENYADIPIVKRLNDDKLDSITILTAASCSKTADDAAQSNDPSSASFVETKKKLDITKYQISNLINSDTKAVFVLAEGDQFYVGFGLESNDNMIPTITTVINSLKKSFYLWAESILQAGKKMVFTGYGWGGLVAKHITLHVLQHFSYKEYQGAVFCCTFGCFGILDCDLNCVDSTAQQNIFHNFSTTSSLWDINGVFTKRNRKLRIPSNSPYLPALLFGTNYLITAERQILKLVGGHASSVALFKHKFEHYFKIIGNILGSDYDSSIQRSDLFSLSVGTASLFHYGEKESVLYLRGKNLCFLNGIEMDGHTFIINDVELSMKMEEAAFLFQCAPKTIALKSYVGITLPLTQLSEYTNKAIISNKLRVEQMGLTEVLLFHASQLLLNGSNYQQSLELLTKVDEIIIEDMANYVKRVNELISTVFRYTVGYLWDSSSNIDKIQDIIMIARYFALYFQQQKTISNLESFWLNPRKTISDEMKVNKEQSSILQSILDCSNITQKNLKVCKDTHKNTNEMEALQFSSIDQLVHGFKAARPSEKQIILQKLNARIYTIIFRLAQIIMTVKTNVKALSVIKSFMTYDSTILPISEDSTGYASFLKELLKYIGSAEYHNILDVEKAISMEFSKKISTKQRIVEPSAKFTVEQEEDILAFCKLMSPISSLRENMLSYCNIGLIGQAKCGKSIYLQGAFGCRMPSDTDLAYKYHVDEQLYITEYQYPSLKTLFRMSMYGLHSTIVFFDFESAATVDNLALLDDIDRTACYSYLICLNRADLVYRNIHNNLKFRTKSSFSLSQYYSSPQEKKDISLSSSSINEGNWREEAVKALSAHWEDVTSQLGRIHRLKAVTWMTCLDDQAFTDLKFVLDEYYAKHPHFPKLPLHSMEDITHWVVSSYLNWKKEV